jgi:hypothetical protein
VTPATFNLGLQAYNSFQFTLGFSGSLKSRPRY